MAVMFDWVFDDTLRLLILIMPKMNVYVKTFDKDNKLKPFCTDDDNLLKKYKSITRKIRELKGVRLTALPVHDDKYLKIK